MNVYRIVWIGLALASIGCSKSSPDAYEHIATQRTVTGNPPIKFLEITSYSVGDEVVVSLEGVGYEDILDMQIFEGFHPGMTPEQAVAKFGPPEKIDKSEDELTCTYATRAGSAVIVRKKEHSGGAAWMNRLRVYPDNKSPLSFLPASIVENLSPNTSYTSVVFLNKDGSPGVEVVLEMGQINYIEWINDHTSAEQTPRRGRGLPL